MTISPANPSVLYGWFQQKLYRTKDGGKSWQFASGAGLPQEGFCWVLRVLLLTVKKKARFTLGHPTDCSLPMILAKAGKY
jgi:hypothetical protein